VEKGTWALTITWSLGSKIIEVYQKWMWAYTTRRGGQAFLTICDEEGGGVEK